MPRPSDGFVHAHASATASDAGRDRAARRREPAVAVDDAADREDARDRLAVEPVRVRGHARTSAVQRSASRSAFSGRSPAARRRHRPRPLSPGSVRSENDPNGVSGAARYPGSRRRRAEEARVVDEAGVLGLLGYGRGARVREQRGQPERRPIASTTRSATSSSPAAVRTPVTCGTPRRVRNERLGLDAAADLDAAAPRRPRARRPTRARPAGGHGDEALVARPRPPVGDFGGMMPSTSKRYAPAASSPSRTSGSTASRTARPREEVVRLAELRDAAPRPASTASSRSRAAAPRRARARSRRGRRARAASLSPAR